MVNISTKVADGYALSSDAGASYHNGDIAPGYAVVGVDEIAPGFESLALEISGGDGEETLYDVKGGFVQWNKKYIKFSKPPTQQSPSCPRIDEPHPSPAPRDRDPPPEIDVEDHLSQHSPSPSPPPREEVSVALLRRKRASSPVAGDCRCAGRHHSHGQRLPHPALGSGHRSVPGQIGRAHV